MPLGEINLALILKEIKIMQFEGIGDAAQALSQFYFTNKDTLPTKVAEMMGCVIGMTRSPVDAVVTTAEVVYAFREEDVSVELKELGAACASLAAVHGYHGFDIDSRGDHISLLLRGRRLPSGVDAPAVAAEYTTPPVNLMVTLDSVPDPVPDRSD